MARDGRDDVAVDSEGRPLPLSPEEVRATVKAALEEGTLVCAILTKGEDLFLQVFGPPSEELLEHLQLAADSYRKLLNRSRH